MQDRNYSTTYYELLREDSARSAERVVPLIIELFSPQTVADIGCGSGTWTAAYKKAGAKILGVDGTHVTVEQLCIAPEEFARHDLTEPLRLGRRFDLVNCLEVAEHLPGGRAASFVGDLCALTDVVFFSAAVPGQGGTHHINEQWPSYWIALFQQQGFEALDCIRPKIWNDGAVAYWYRQNAFAFIRAERVKDFPRALEWSRTPAPQDLVHPQAFLKAALPAEMSPRMLKEVARALPHFPGKIWRHLKGPK
jgi:SAM-dependent methyltransferase